MKVEMNEHTITVFKKTDVHEGPPLVAPLLCLTPKISADGDDS